MSQVYRCRSERANVKKSIPKPGQATSRKPARSAEYWKLRYVTRSGEHRTLYYAGSYAGACAKAKAVHCAKVVLWCQTVSDLEYEVGSKEMQEPV